MLFNKKQLYTLALNRLGITEPVELNTNNVNVAVLDNEYPVALETLLSETDWNFARKSRILTLEKEQNGKYYFDIPNDCVKVREVFSLLNNKKLKFDVMNGQIVTTENTAELFYTTNNIDENKFPADFVRTLSYSLAAAVALCLTESDTKVRLMTALYTENLQKTVYNNANEGNEYLPENEYYEDR